MPEINKIVANPLVSNVTLDWSVLVPALYAVVIEQVTVTFPVVLLKRVTASPALNTLLGIVIEPLAPTSIKLPASPATKVYDEVFADPDCGTDRKDPSASVTVVNVPAAAEFAPITAPSIDPPFISIVVKAAIWSAPTASSAILAVVTASSARSAVTIVPSTIFADVTVSSPGTTEAPPFTSNCVGR